MDGIVFQNLRNIENLISLKKDYCIHAKLCEILFKPEGRGKSIEDCAEHFIEEVMDNKKQSICLVHPSVSLAKSPGIVVVNSRATKPKCHTCKGKNASV